ncbi:MAG: FlxA-like family protein [Patescibacteria group bacterium]|nr:FlxA-like family protein [Patescibacteria group bacterium]
MRKKIFISAVFFLALSALIASQPVSAITIDELKAQIAALQAQIAQLTQQLSQIQGDTTAWCYTFNVNLGIGSGGGEVNALHSILSKEVIAGDFGWAGDNFDEDTASYVVALQEKYASEILKPYGLAHGTGYVGKSTRAKLNKLYGCGNNKVCAMDAKQCSDGSYVSRTGPNCEFAQCPITACVKEGETYSSSNKLVCCNSFAGVLDASVREDSQCIFKSGSAYQGSIYVCTNCGNGVCGNGENQCNCPQDCKKKSMTVIYPNGGETLYFGNTYTIKWTSWGVEKAVVYLWFSDGGTCLLGSVPASQGSYTFKPEENKGCPNLAKGLTSGQYKAYIVTEDADLGVGGAGAQDSSDNYFSITASTATTQ